MDNTTQVLAIQRVRLDSLTLDPANARTHPENNLEAIVASLQRFGQAEPLVVQAGSRRVIGGNGRLVAMRKLGWKECDVVELAIDDLKARALGIALNRTAELAAWDLPALTKLLGELNTQDSLDGTGFDLAQLDELLAELEDSSPAELDDQGPEEPPEKPVSRTGDLWLLGDHRLLCGDSTKKDDVARVLAGEKVELLATDPPYCVRYTGNDRPIHDGKPSGKDWSHLYREVDIEDLGAFLDAVFDACLPHIKEKAPVYCWHDVPDDLWRRIEPRCRLSARSRAADDRGCRTESRWPASRTECAPLPVESTPGRFRFRLNVPSAADAVGSCRRLREDP